MPKCASLYIHIPFCRKRCGYCDFFSTCQNDESVFSFYIDTLIKDISFFKQSYSIDFFNTVYIGGGTPSILKIDEIAHLASFICSSQKVKIKEFSIEANPTDITKDKLKAWEESGINRLSLGLQSFSDNVLNAEGRMGSRKNSLRALELLSFYWKGDVSFDFIAGLSKQSMESLIDDLHTSLQFSPCHISLYELISHRKESKTEEIRKMKIWDAGLDYLEKHNYLRYEVSNFSYNGNFECEHNKTYWHLKDYIGIGAGATGNVNISNLLMERFTGICDVQKYIKKENRKDAYNFEYVKDVDVIKDALLMGFRLLKGVERERFKKDFGFDLLTLLPKTFNKWQEKKLLTVEKTLIKLTSSGIALLNAFLLDSFVELDQSF